MTPPEVGRAATDGPKLDRVVPVPPASTLRADALPDPEPADEGNGLHETVTRSLAEDLQALFDDGKTYLEAEYVYQKTRAAFVADRAKGAFVFGALAALFGFLALIGLTVGLILALSPLLTVWGASALVVALLAVAALLAVRAASRRWKALMAAIEGEPETGA